MSTLIVVLHIFACVLLILIVLLQAGKGADAGATLGVGGAQTVFGAGGAAPFLTKLTTAMAVIFMLTSIGLTIMTSHEMRKTVVDTLTPATQPLQAPEQSPSMNQPSVPAQGGAEK
ncbi:MAG: preprotein translocase subunit SecG [Deltaproteobacteria bacterium]|nr:preprotein translocase subunit SecG [Deltaproteobacteria bacterium]